MTQLSQRTLQHVCLQYKHVHVGCIAARKRDANSKEQTGAVTASSITGIGLPATENVVSQSSAHSQSITQTIRWPK